MTISCIHHYDYSEIEDDIERLIIIANISSKFRKQCTIMALRVFYIYLTLHYEYSANKQSFFELLTDKIFTEKELGLFYYFIYEHCFKNDLKTKYAVCNFFKFFLIIITKDHLAKKIKFSTTSISKDLKEFSHSYKLLKIDKELLNFYSTWEVTTLSKSTHNLNLTNIYLKFGKNFSDHYHIAMMRIASTMITTSFSRIISNTNALNKLMFDNYKSFEELMKAFSPNTVHLTLHNFYNLLLIENLEQKNSLKFFHIRWRQIVNTYYLLVDHNLFEKPIHSILIPKFKTSGAHNHYRVTTGEIFNNKLIFDIPLSFTDSTAKEKIFQRLNIDINYILRISEIKSEQLKLKFKKIFDLAEKSILPIKGEKQNYRLFNSGPEDVCATYLNIYQYQPSFSLNAKKFGYMDNRYLKNLLPSLHHTDYYPLLILLINEHPQITESWLVEWKLYENENLYGFQKVGDNYIIISLKRRKKTKAIQKIILNKRSKKIVEDLIYITTIIRKNLKSRGDSNYEYMLLENTSIFSIPKKVKKIYNPSTKNTSKYFEYLFKDQNLMLLHPSQENATQIFGSFSLTKFRATRAVQIYLETNSIQKMSFALGHENLDQRLINSYLPTPLWDYFTDRWIRIYQNILIYEAMKETNILFDAIDINAEELDEFIKNHHFGILPEFLKQGKYKQIKDPIQIDQLGVFAISVPLLQWFIAIIKWANISNQYNKGLNEISQKWYECALLVISQIELSFSKDNTNGFALFLDENINEMYKLAKENPISIDLIKRVLA